MKSSKFIYPTLFPQTYKKPHQPEIVPRFLLIKNHQQIVNGLINLVKV